MQHHTQSCCSYLLAMTNSACFTTQIYKSTCPAAGPCSRIVDVDFVAQLEHLHEADAERILGSIDRDMVSRHISSNSDLVADASLLRLCRSLESVLEIVSGQSTLWPANMRPRYPGSQN